MSFAPGGDYGSVFGTGDYGISSRDYGWDPLGGPIFEDWWYALLPSIVLNEAVQATSTIFGSPGVSGSGDPAVPAPATIPVLGATVAAQAALPAVGVGSVGVGEVQTAVEPGGVWVAADPGTEEVNEDTHPELYGPPVIDIGPERGSEGPGDYGYAWPEENEVATDWGAVVGGVAQILTGNNSNPSVYTPHFPAGFGTTNTVPAQVTVDTRTGKVTPCRRRRRRRLLTPTDLADLASLASLVGKSSDAMRFAVTKAVRR